MQTVNKTVAETQCVNTTDEPLKLRSRIGSTVYEVNVWNSSFALRRLSDIICAENGLSVIQNPKDKGQSYEKWLGNEKKTPYNPIIKNTIDELLLGCVTFEDLLHKLRHAGFTVNQKRKNISVSAPGQKRPTRLNSLSDEYSEIALSKRINSKEPVKAVIPTLANTKVSLLIDIQTKIREGKGPGYEQWSKIFNLKQASKTLIFLQENGIDSYEDLKKISSSASGEFSTLRTEIKAIESRLKEISELQKHIGQYSKTRDIYAGYKAGGWSRDYYDEHATEIILHRAAKKFFGSLGTKKLPPMKALKQEYATLAAEKKKLYSGYHKMKQNSRDLTIAQRNADLILGIGSESQNHEKSNQWNRENSHGK